MKKNEKMAVIAFVAFFLILGVILFFTVARPNGPSRSIEDNVMIDQRMKNRNIN